jgi:hypothetical protein
VVNPDNHHPSYFGAPAVQYKAPITWKPSMEMLYDDLKEAMPEQTTYPNQDSMWS